MTDFARCVVGVVGVLASIVLFALAQCDRHLAEAAAPVLVSLVTGVMVAEVSITKWRHDHGR